MIKTFFEQSAIRKATALFVAITLGVLSLSALSLYADVTPPMVEDALPPEGSIDVDKQVTTPTIPPDPEICFLADTTGSMGPALGNVQANAVNIMNTIIGVQPTAEFCVTEYRDIGDVPLFAINQGMTTNTAAVQAAIGTWSAFGGGDIPEAQLNALHEVATNAGVGYNGPNRIVVWFGDSSGHDPSNGNTQASVIAELQAAGIQVIAIPVVTLIGNGLDATGQATAITSQTNGVLLPGATPNQVSNAILAGLTQLTTDVWHSTSCDAGLDVTLSPTVHSNVVGGSTVGFTETITVAGDAPQGGSVHCTVTFLANSFPDGGSSIGEQEIWIDVVDVTPPEIHLPPDAVNEATGPDGSVHEYEVTAWDNVDGEVPVVCVPPSGSVFPIGDTEIVCTATDSSGNTSSDSFTKTVVDTTPPVASCLETVNPHGKKIPPAGNTTLPGSKGGQNEDGFYELGAVDLVDPNPEIWVSGFGPFASGDKVKVTEAPGSNPKMKKMGSINGKGQADAITAHLILDTDPFVTATDDFGNVSDPAECLVPPLPK